MKLVSNHDLNLVRLLGDDNITAIRRDLCEELNISYEEENFSRVDEIIRKTWTPETLDIMKRDIRSDNIWRGVSKLITVMIPIALIPFLKKKSLLG
jgi:hypothetical protein